MTNVITTKLDLELLRIVDLKDILLNCTYKRNIKKDGLVTTILDFLQSDKEDISDEQKACMCSKIKYHTRSVRSKHSSIDVSLIRLKCSPLFDNLCTLLQPSPILSVNNLVESSKVKLHSSVFSFHLTPQQVSDLREANSDTIVLLRFCLLDISCEQDDNFPLNLKLKVNKIACALPNPLPMKSNHPQRYLPGPINITEYLKPSALSTNEISCEWEKEFFREHVISCYLVCDVPCDQLLQKLRHKGVVKKDYTTRLIKDKMNDADGEISTTSLRVSLNCPLGKKRMVTPCRATTCLHLQCFDAAFFLEMNKIKQTFICPVCDQKALYENLVIDEYFLEVLASCSLSTDDNEIELKNDGSWNKICNKSVFFNLDLTPETKLEPKFEGTSDHHPNEVPLIDLTNLTTPVKPNTSSGKRFNTMPDKTNVTVDLTFSDSDDDTIAAKKIKRN